MNKRSNKLDRIYYHPIIQKIIIGLGIGCLIYLGYNIFTQWIEKNNFEIGNFFLMVFWFFTILNGIKILKEKRSK